MKKRLLPLLIAAAMMVAATACDSTTTAQDNVSTPEGVEEIEVNDGEIEEPDDLEAEEPGESGSFDVDATAYQIFNDASSAYQEADSYAMTYSMDMDMVFGDESISQKVTGDIKMAYADDDVQFSMTTSTNAAGQSIDMTAYYADGFYYVEYAGQKIKMSMPMDTAMEQLQSAEVNFEENMIIEQSIDGNILTFTLDGQYMSDMLQDTLAEMLAGLGTEGSVSYGDVSYVVTLTDSGELAKMSITCDIDMEVEGETATAAVDMDMNITQIGDVTVDLPDDLDDYVEASM